MKEPKRLDIRIQECYDDLPPAERRLGELLLNFPGDIAYYSATELAKLAGTSKAAATRLFRRLGYTDFNEARLQSREAQRWGSPLYQKNTETVPTKENFRQRIDSHMEREINSLRHTLEALNPDLLHEIVIALSSKRRIAVVGFRNSRFMAEYFQHQLSLLRPDVVLLHMAGQTIAEDLIDFDHEDLLVVIGLRRRISKLKDLMTLATNHNIQTLLIADPSAAELYRLASWTLNCQVHNSSLFDSYTSVNSVLTLLINLTLHENMSNGLARLRKIEALHEEMGELKVGGVHPLLPDELLKQDLSNKD